MAGQGRIKKTTAIKLPTRLPKGMEDFSINPRVEYSNEAWNKDPYWRKIVDQITLARRKGLTDEQIYLLVGVDKQIVHQIILAEEVADRKAKKVFAEKVPVIQDIIGLSLSALCRTLKEMDQDDELRRKMLGKASDVLTLTKAIEGLNTLLRLELNQATQNIAVKASHSVSLRETKAVLENMSKIDPVFSYPQITDEVVERQQVIDDKKNSDGN